MKTETKPTHTPTPLKIGREEPLGITLRGRVFGICPVDPNDPTELKTIGYIFGQANAAFIVRAVNSFEKLLDYAKGELARYPENSPRWKEIAADIAQAEGRA